MGVTFEKPSVKQFDVLNHVDDFDLSMFYMI